MEKAACLPPLTAEYKHMKHFSSPGNPLSQSLAMTTDTPAGRRQRPCHVIVPIGLLTQASCRATLGGWGRAALHWERESSAPGGSFRGPEGNSRPPEWKSEYFINNGREAYSSQIKEE